MSAARTVHLALAATSVALLVLAVPARRRRSSAFYPLCFAAWLAGSTATVIGVTS